jgi:subtilase family serine protease
VLYIALTSYQSDNSTGRGYPDVAAIAMNVAIVMQNNEYSVGGTSCAAPVVSAIFSLLNDIRIRNRVKSFFVIMIDVDFIY